MYVQKCPVCGSSHTLKNGTRDGRQLYICGDCRYQFRVCRHIPLDVLWHEYSEGKQTTSELAKRWGVSCSTIKRRLREVVREWQQPALCGGGFVHLDTTYWGRNWGVLLAIDSRSGRPLFLKFVRHECVDDYREAVCSIRERGYEVRGVIIDGIRSLFRLFADLPIQMCQFHMRQIVRRYISNKPRLLAARELKELMSRLTQMEKQEFEAAYEAWKIKWDSTLKRRSLLKSGKTHFTHRRLRSAMLSIDFYLPYLFTYQRSNCQGMPNTNNKIEGVFTDLKKNLNIHSGMNETSRKRLISGFFLAWKEL